MLDLITQRTQADVDRVKDLAAKGWAGMTDAERDEWMGVSALDITVQGRTAQTGSGTPAPDNIRPISFVSAVAGEHLGVEYSIPLTSPLCSGDTLRTNINRECVETRSTGVLVLDGTEAWEMSQDDPTTRFVLSGAAVGCSGVAAGQICSHYVAASYATIDLRFYAAANGTVFIHHKAHTDPAAFKAYLAAQYAAGTPVTIVYSLAAPVTYTHERVLAEVENAVTRGAYGYRDLNRVENAVKTLATSLGITLTVKTDWTVSDAPRVADMTRYLSNVRALARGNDAVSSAVLPESMAGLTWYGANNIEQFLLDVEVFLETYHRSGEIFCGEAV